MVTGKAIAKGALIVMAATLFSRLFGFVREMVVANQFGATEATDAYQATAPVIIGVGMAIAAAVSASFIPVFNKYLVVNDRESANRVANTIVNTLFSFLLVVVLAVVFFMPAPALVKLFAPGFSGVALQLTGEMVIIMFPALIFVSLMGLASGFLNSNQHFLLPALGPMVTSLFIIAAAVFLSPIMGIKGLAFGTMFGFAGQFLIQLPMMYKKGYRYRADFAIFDPGVVRFFKLMFPVLIASMVPPLILLVERRLASGLDTGSIAALTYAFRLMQLPLGLFVMAVSVPLFPALASFAAQKNFEKVKTLLIKGVSVLALIMIPATAGLIALNEPIVRLLFERGAFEAKDTLPTAYALSFYALALLPLAVRDIFRRGFYSIQDTLTPVVITVALFGINVVFNIFLVKTMGIGGLALGAALSTLIEAVVLYMVLNRKLGKLPGKSFFNLLPKLFLAAAIMGISTHYCSNMIGELVNLGAGSGRIIQVGISVILGLLVYLGAVIILKVQEVSEAWGMISSYLKKVTQGSA